MPPSNNYGPNTPVWVMYDGTEYAGITRIYGDGKKHGRDEVIVFFPETHEQVWIREDSEHIRKRVDQTLKRRAPPKAPKQKEVSFYTCIVCQLVSERCTQSNGPASKKRRRGKTGVTMNLLFSLCKCMCKSNFFCWRLGMGYLFTVAANQSPPAHEHSPDKSRPVCVYFPVDETCDMNI